MAIDSKILTQTALCFAPNPVIATRKLRRSSFAAWIWTKKLRYLPNCASARSHIANSKRKLNMNVPLLDLKAQYTSIKSEIDAAIAEVFESQHFILGPKVEQCEKAVASYSSTTHGIGVSSG